MVSTSKHITLLIAVLANAVLGLAQNLVPNGSFEEYTACPEFISSVFLTGWENLHTNSADYFNACNTTVAGVPLNQFGYQYAADGQAYVGMATTSNASGTYREIVGIQLTEPLQPGVPVCLSFKTAMGGFGSWPGNSTSYSSKGLGLQFFTEFPSDWGTYLYPNTAALHIEYVPTDTAIWYHVTGTYVPDSSYSYIAVGNFFADSLSERTLIDSTGFGTAFLAYAFVDDVRASFDLGYCELGVSIKETMDRYRIFPNPCGDRVWVERGSYIPGQVRYELFDLEGRRLLGGVLNDAGRGVIELGQLAFGTYLLKLADSAGFGQCLPLVHVSP
jgi:hypothetical protein